jgi:AraC-like DNA-binding protein
MVFGRPRSPQQWAELAGTAGYRARELARLCRLSDRQLRRVIQRQLGRSPQQWLNEQRIIAARRRLLTGEPVKVVALELGFKQSSHFCRQFKSANQMTATDFILAHAPKGRCG